MKKTTRRYIPRFAAVCAAAVLMFGMMTVAYAADIGGIQRRVQLWLYGEQTDAVLEVQDGSYTLSYQDAQGESHTVYGGGAALGPGGQQRPVTEEEILEQLNMPEVVYGEDGSVWVYYRSQKLDITNAFDEDGVCYLHLKDESGSQYMTIRYNDGYAISPHKYPDPVTHG